MVLWQTWWAGIYRVEYCLGGKYIRRNFLDCNNPGGNFLGGNFPGRNFPGGSYPGWEFSRWGFSRWELSWVGIFFGGGFFWLLSAEMILELWNIHGSNEMTSLNKFFFKKYLWCKFQLASLAKWLNVSYKLSGCRFESSCSHLRVQSCKLYNNKYMITSTQIANTEISTFIALLILKLLRCKVMFINRKDNRNC